MTIVACDGNMSSDAIDLGTGQVTFAWHDSDDVLRTWTVTTKTAFLATSPIQASWSWVLTSDDSLVALAMVHHEIVGQIERVNDNLWLFHSLDDDLTMTSVSPHLTLDEARESGDRFLTKHRDRIDRLVTSDD